jgi:hypothetical protein
MGRHSLGQNVALRSDLVTLAAGMAIDVVFGLDHGLEVTNGNVEVQPPLALRGADALAGDARFDQPVRNGFDAFVPRGKEPNYLVGSVVLAVFFRRWIGSASCVKNSAMIISNLRVANGICTYTSMR